MSSDTDPIASEQKALPPRRPVETILGKDIFLPRIANPKILRDRSGTLYVRYPDGSMRRATPKGALQRFAKKPYHPRTIIRDYAAAMRAQKYLGGKEAA
jgi:hypothetical protein